MNRRNFLHPRHLSQFLDSLEPDPAPPPSEILLLRYGRQAMATTFDLLLPIGSPIEAAEDALDLIDRLEDQLTVYRDHSEISRLNARAFREPLVVEEELFDLLLLCQQLYQATEGAFDVTLGALIKAWGFYRRQGRVPDPETLAQARSRSGMANVLLDASAKTVHYRVEGLEINLGSIGKGYALDRVIQQLWKEGNLRQALVHGGHSSLFALGDEPGSKIGWTVGLADPRYSNRRLGCLRLRHRGMGTSAASFQFLEHEGRRLGHLLDPRSGWPAEGLLQATVTAPSAAAADALATAFFILGADRAQSYCEQYPEIGAVLLTQEPRLIVLGQARSEFFQDHHPSRKR